MPPAGFGPTVPEKSSSRPQTAWPLGPAFLHLQNILLYFSKFYTTKSRNLEILNSVRAGYCALVRRLYIYYIENTENTYIVGGFVDTIA
jgi:hypothetical protein